MIQPSNPPISWQLSCFNALEIGDADYPAVPLGGLALREEAIELAGCIAERTGALLGHDLLELGNAAQSSAAPGQPRVKREVYLPS